MADQMYKIIVLPEWVAPRVLRALQSWFALNDGDVYHKMEPGKEKQEHGMMLHDIAGTIAKLLPNTSRFERIQPWPWVKSMLYPPRSYTFPERMVSYWQCGNQYRGCDLQFRSDYKENVSPRCPHCGERDNVVELV